MRIHELAKELGVASKDVIAFLTKKHGGRYTASNGLNESEISLTREFFKSGGDLSALDAPTPVKTKRRKRGERTRYVPVSEQTEQQADQSFSEQSTEELPVEAEEENVVPKADNEPDSPRETQPQVSPEDLMMFEMQQEEQRQAEEERTKEESGETSSEEQEATQPPATKPEKIEIPDEAIPLPPAQTEEADLVQTPPATGDAHKKHRKKVVIHAEEKSIGNRKKGSRGRKPSTSGRGRHEKIKAGVTALGDDFMQGGSRKKRKKSKKKEKAVTPPPNPTKASKMVVKIEDSIVLSELAHRMGVKSSQLIGKLMQMGEMATLNDRLPFDTAALIAEEFGFQVQNVALNEESFLEQIEEREEDLVPRPPVVTVMGHVDHGKTKLLDTIRNTNVVDREAGGITQHIGAYSVEIDGKMITFLDTPGHEAFTAMRSRGAQATDVVILIVAADDGVMPQTVEAINHAKAAGVPIIVAINKIDKPEANPQKVRNELLKHGIVAEELGGDTLFVEISAKQNINIPELLETVLLQVEVMDLKANPNRPAQGIVIESRMDVGRGPVATTLIKEGTLKIGDLIVVGTSIGFVRTMIDWKGTRLKEATPSMAVEITGLDTVPSAGEMIYSFNDDQKARGLVDWRKKREKEQKFETDSPVTLDNLFEQIQEGSIQNINIIVKADVDGSVDAIVSMLEKIEHNKMRVRVIHKGVGGITENDVLLASASNAIIVGFNVRMDNKAKQIAAHEGVDIKQFSIIYDLIDSVKAALTGRLAPILKEEYTGSAEIKQLFKVAKIGTIGGSMVVDGKIVKNGKVKLIRNNVVIYEGKLSSLKRFQQDEAEVKAGFECGIMIENYNDIKEGDIIECYRETEVQDEVK